RKQLEYSFLVSMGDAYRDFEELTALALDHTCALYRLQLDATKRQRLAESWRLLPAFGDVAPALRMLRARGIASAVLTNGTRGAADAVLERAAVRNFFADVLSVQEVRCYKPDPRAYRLATERFACTPREIVFVSSNGFDAWGAGHFGFRVAWCNRGRLPAETLPPSSEVTLAGLDELEAFVTS
ncbi:MAG TPA: haloacid dehalogenase type II, partial [Candidatus Acidoferrum sp.]|nr:haloacid dehalogenase type II [Candidatus Acidoferrum sp.]